MSRHKETSRQEGFEQKLEQLRRRIDSLPESQRPYLYELADTIKQQHRRLGRHGHSDNTNR